MTFKLGGFKCLNKFTFGAESLNYLFVYGGRGTLTLTPGPGAKTSSKKNKGISFLNKLLTNGNILIL